MIWRGTKSRVRGLSATLGAFAVVSTGMSLSAARPASAQDIERVLAGIRLNSKSSSVLAKFGNPNEVVIGDVGVRGFGPSGQPGGGAGNGSPGDEGGAGGTLPGVGAAGGGGGKGRGFGGAPPPGVDGGGGARPGGFGGPPPGAGGGFGGPPPGAGGGFGAPQGGFGEGDGAGAGPGGGGAVGGFGQTVSTLARQQEVTWIYNRKVNNNVVSYNFLIGPNGNVVQILVSGYNGGNSKTKKGIGLGSTYKDVVRVYGYPEEHAIIGRTLIASYRTKAHVSFQFLSDAPQANPMATGNKVIAVTIATVE